MLCCTLQSKLGHVSLEGLVKQIEAAQVSKAARKECSVVPSPFLSHLTPKARDIDRQFFDTGTQIQHNKMQHINMRNHFTLALG